jgi:hypothetical protein
MIQRHCILCSCANSRKVGNPEVITMLCREGVWQDLPEQILSQKHQIVFFSLQ